MPSRRTSRRRGQTARRKKSRPAQEKKKSILRDDWQPVYYETAQGKVPGRDFFEDLQKEEKHKTPRRELLKTLLAVCEVGPAKYPTGMGWHAMHRPKAKREVDMSGIHEVRDQHGDQLYRLYCLCDESAKDHGLALPSIVVLDGAVKRVGEAMSQSVYRRVDGYRRDYNENHRVATRPKKKSG